MKKSLRFFLILLLPAALHAQSINIQNGSSIYIGANQLISLDSLSLVPESGFTLSGPNQLSRTTTITHSASNPTVTRFYNFTTPVTGFSGTIRFFYRESDLGTIDESDLVLSIYNGSNWLSYNTDINRNPVRNDVSVLNLSNLTLSELTLSSQLNPLPLLWKSLSLRPAATSNEINWSTSNETNCNFFIVEKSTDGSNWLPASGSIPALNGTTNEYSWTDINTADTRYYRIRLVNIDNSNSYSKIIAVNQANETLVRIFPNPVQNKLTVYATSPSSIIKSAIVFGVNGNQLTLPTDITTTSVTLDVAAIPAGSYLIRTTFSNGKQNVQFFQKK